MSVEQSVTEAPAPQGGAEEHFSSGSEGGSGEFESEGSDARNPHGMGQSKSSRRRRRKRKGKGGEAGAAGSDGGVEGGSEAAPGEGDSAGNGGELASVQAARAQPAPARQAGNANSGANGNQASAANGGNAPGTKRWKKKFRDRQRGGETAGAQGATNAGGNGSGGNGAGGNGFGGQPAFRSADTHQPGNNALKRKGGGFSKQRSGGGGSRGGGFVGPMDHSYRPVNGNIFDGAPAADAYAGGGRGGRNFHTSDSQPIDYSQGRAIPIREDAPTKIFFFIDDLFFTAKITETARKLGVKIAFVKNEKEQIAALTSGGEEDRPGLIVFDLNNANAKPLTLIPKLKTKLKKTTSIVGFLSHLQGDLKAKAVEAGCDTVMPRAAFSQNLPNLLRRYGIEEVEETNYNQ